MIDGLRQKIEIRSKGVDTHCIFTRLFFIHLQYMVTWIEHVKNCQKKMGLTYKEAMANIDCRNSYKEIKQQKEPTVSKSKEAAYAQRRQRGMSVDRLKTPMTTIGERRMEEFRKILKVNRQKYAKQFGQEFTDQAALSRGQAAEKRRRENPLVPRRKKKLTDEEFLASLTPGQAAENRRIEKPPVPRRRKKMTDEEFERSISMRREDEEISLAAKKLFAAAQPKKKSIPKVTPRGKSVPKKK